MLTGNEHYVVVKLISGEQIMAVLEYETEETVELAYPMLIRMFPIVVAGKSHEHVTATPYSQFSEDPIISIHKRNIIFLKNLHHMLIPHFTKIVQDAEQTVLVKRDSTGQVNRAEDLVWEDEELEREMKTLTTEEIQKRIDVLEAIFGSEEPEEEKTTFVEGNRTLH